MHFYMRQQREFQRFRIASVNNIDNEIVYCFICGYMWSHGGPPIYQFSFLPYRVGMVVNKELVKQAKGVIDQFENLL